jgi:hypothetical protein
MYACVGMKLNVKRERLNQKPNVKMKKMKKVHRNDPSINKI